MQIILFQRINYKLTIFLAIVFSLNDVTILLIIFLTLQYLEKSFEETFNYMEAYWDQFSK